MKTLREEIEDVIVRIQLRRSDIKQGVDDLLKQRGDGNVKVLDKSAQDGSRSDVRFKNQPSEEFEVTDTFDADETRFMQGDCVCARTTDDGKVELENRESGQRANLTVKEFEDTLPNLHQKRGEEFEF